MDPIRLMLLAGLVALAVGCHTYEGAKQDAQEAGQAVERGVRQAGEAAGRALERTGTAIEDTFEK
jgi:predicted small secreted protein